MYGTQILLQVTLHVCYSAFITEYLYLGIYNLDHQFMGEETGHRVDCKGRNGTPRLSEAGGTEREMALPLCFYV